MATAAPGRGTQFVLNWFILGARTSNRLSIRENRTGFTQRDHGISGGAQTRYTSSLFMALLFRNQQSNIHGVVINHWLQARSGVGAGDLTIDGVHTDTRIDRTAAGGYRAGLEFPLHHPTIGMFEGRALQRRPRARVSGFTHVDRIARVTKDFF